MRQKKRPYNYPTARQLYKKRIGQQADMKELFIELNQMQKQYHSLIDHYKKSAIEEKVGWKIKLLKKELKKRGIDI